MFIGELDVDVGYERIRWIVVAQLITGHIVSSPDRSCVTVSFFSSFFCDSKVIETQFASCRLGSECGISMLSLKNLKFLTQSSLVRRWS